MKSYVAFALSIAASLQLTALHAQEITVADRAAAERVAVGTCATCHGPRGHSISPKFPVLAGQHATYLASQMDAFKAQTRGDPDAIGYMWGMAAPLDNSLIAALADYYSKQSPKTGPKTDTSLIARGKDIYEHGNAAEGIPACAACHGQNAGGSADYLSQADQHVPRLAGQHVQYLMKQLRSFQSNLRDVAVMHGVAKGLQESEMRSVAAYLQSL